LEEDMCVNDTVDIGGIEMRRKGYPYHQEPGARKSTTYIKWVAWILMGILVALTLIGGCGMNEAWAMELTASWYSVQSLKDEGTWKHSKGVMANGRQFSDDSMVAASWNWPLGTKVKVTRTDTKASVVVLVADRTARRFKDKRIDLSKKAFGLLADHKQGLVLVTVEAI